MTSTNTGPKTRSRISLLIVFALFLTPVVLAWLIFYVFPDWQPTATNNHGQLVTPVRLLPDFTLPTVAGEKLEETWLKERWTLVYLAQGKCEKTCIQQLYTIRQVRLTQGKNIGRLQRLFIWNAEGTSEQKRAELKKHFPGQVMILTDNAESPLVNVFNLEGKQPFLAGRIYLVDPRGFLMMSYEPGADTRGMIKDLEKLLKYSATG